MKKRISRQVHYNKKNDLAVNLGEFFCHKRGQKRIAEFLLKNAIRIDGEKLFYKDIEIPHTSIARTLSVDRRVIKSTAESIARSPELSEIYKKLDSALILRDVAPMLGFGAIEIIPTSASKKGIIAGITRIIVNSGIGLRQVMADDPMFSGAQTTVITEKPIPRKLLDKMLKIPGVKKIVVVS
jgi:predicted regulator of amino acid metabolism with ACT domain